LLALDMRPRMKCVAMTVLLLGAVVAYVIVSNEGLLSDPNIVAREQVWSSAFQAVKKNPIAGIGHGNLGFVHEFHVPSQPGPIYRSYHAHSLLSLGAEFGLPTLMVFIALISSLLMRLLRRETKLAGVTLAVALLLNLFDLTLFSAAVLPF